MAEWHKGSIGAARGGRWLAAAVLVVGLLLGVVATRYVQRNVEGITRARFNLEAEEAVQEIAKRMEAYIATIRSTAALFTASERVTREEFRHFVGGLDLPANYPGVQGLGFALRLEGTPAEREATVRQVLAGYPIYAAPPGGRETAIVMLEPLDVRNRVALGYDMYAEPNRRAAMARARDTGEPAASGRVELVQEITPERQAGFNIYVPVYRTLSTPATVEGRRRELAGWVYSPFRVRDLVQGIFGGRLPFDLAIVSSKGGDGDRWLYRSDGPATAAGALVAEQRLEVAGETWTIVVRGPARAGQSEALLAPLVLFASGLVTLLLFGVVWSQVQGREAAEEASIRMRASEEERARLLEAERAARWESEQARQRAAFLADVSTLLGSTLSVGDMLQKLTHRVIPFAGDGCAIDLWDEEGELRREVMAYVDPAVEAFGTDLFQTTALTAAVAPIVRRVAETGERVLLSEVPPDGVAGSLPPHLQAMARKVLGSYVVAPLPSREGTLGTISLSAEEPGRFGRVELELASDLGRRVALAIENTRLYANAQEAIRVRDDFLSIASHELRTPLTALQAHLQGLLRAIERPGDGRLPPDQLKARLETALRQTRRLGKLVNELLDVSRISAGRLHLERETFDLAELATELAERFREEAHRAGSEIRVDAPPGATGSWDRHRLDQVLTNLLANAIKYGAGEPIELEVRELGATVCVRVHDAGIGISSEAQARIFGRFERASSERHYGGLGLGLYITSEIVAAHGGRISVQSEPGAGATFLVTLPRAPPGAPSG